MEQAFSKHSFPLYGEFIQLSRYSRWLPEENRRESWEEVVDRLISFWEGRYPFLKDEGMSDILREAILTLEIMPSMRTLMTAGKALDRDEVAGYNCSFIAINRQRAFDELMYVLMCG